jgi:hypothetical protein
MVEILEKKKNSSSLMQLLKNCKFFYFLPIQLAEKTDLLAESFP